MIDLQVVHSDGQSDGDYDSDEWIDDDNDVDADDADDCGMDASIGKNWKERIKSDEQDKENRKNRINGQVMEYDPPEKMPKNSPSYLIWSIFTKEREERARRAKRTFRHNSQIHFPTCD